MLILPTHGINKSVKTQNIDFEILSDWIEASILILDTELSYVDIVDVLIEEERYDNEDFAKEGLNIAWEELKRRRHCIGDRCAYEIDENWIVQRVGWKVEPAQSFCVLLSLAPNYDWWFREFGHDYTEQGELFELLTGEAIRGQFNNWKIFQTGWTRTSTMDLSQVVEEVAERLGGEVVGLKDWDGLNSKELGLDLLCYRPFPDNRTGFPNYLVQCASGGNWSSKLPTPNLEIWADMIRFPTIPQRGFSAPFAFMEDTFRNNCVIVKGLLFDRGRLLGTSRYRDDWLSGPLSTLLINWIEPRINILINRSI